MRAVRKGTRFVAALCGLLLLLPLCGCGSTPAVEKSPEEWLLLDAANSAGLRIVRSDGADDQVIRTALRIRQRLKELCGADVDICSDWTRDNEQPPELPEIHVGVTDCAANGALLEALAAEKDDCFYINTVEDRIFLLATGEKLLDRAAEEFLDKFVQVQEGRVYISKKISVREVPNDRVTLVRNNAVVGGILLPNDCGSVLIDAVSAFSAEMKPYIHNEFSVFSCEKPEEELDGKQIRIRVVFRDGMQSFESRVTAKNESLLIEAGGEAAAAAAFGELANLLSETQEITWNGGFTLFYPRELQLDCSWRYAEVPYLFGAKKVEENSISTNSSRVVFEGVSRSRFLKFSGDLTKAGILLANSSTESYRADTATLQLQLYYNADAARMTVYITQY